MSICRRIVLSGASPSSATTVAGTVAAGTATDSVDPQEWVNGFQSLRIQANLQGATGGTLNVYVQTSYDGGTTWHDYVSYTQLAAGAAAVTYASSHTRAKGDALATPTDGTMTANTARDGEWGDRFRLKMTAGAGTSAGTTQSVTLFMSN